jgi:tetratricopeptide (TPR) repeat protein
MSLKYRIGLAGVLLASTLCFSQAAGDKQQQIEQHARKAQEYLRDKKPDLAIPELQTLVELDPNNADAQGNLGVLLFFKGNYADAAPHLRATLKLKPELWKIQGLLGMCETRIGEAASARADLQAAFPHLDGDKSQDEVGRELIDNYSATGELDKAAAVVSVLRTQHPDDASLLYTAYRIYSDLAGEAMLSISVIAPHSAQMHQVMAHEMARQGDRAGAIAQFREALRLNPNLPGLHFELAEALNTSQSGGSEDQALSEYRAAVAINSLDEKAECRLGEIAARHGDLKESYSHYDRAVQLQPLDSEAAIGLAKALVSMNQPDKALPLLEHAVQEDPTSSLAHFRLSALYRKLGRNEDATRELKQYQKYKEMKEQLGEIYKQMRLQPAKQESTDTDARQ